MPSTRVYVGAVKENVASIFFLKKLCLTFTGPRRHAKKMAKVGWKEAIGGSEPWRMRMTGIQILSQRTSKRKN